MKSLLTILAGAMLHCTSIVAQNTDSLFFDAAIAKLRNAKDYTLKVANLMPEEKYSYQPTPGEMNFREQLLHISANMGWLCSSYLNGSENPITAADKKAIKKEDVIAIVTKTYDYAINTLLRLDKKYLPDTVSFFAGPLNKLQIINLLNDHQTHHRGQLLVYLRLNEIKPPDYVGW